MKVSKLGTLVHMAGSTQQALYELAEDRYGFVTVEDAAQFGLPARRLAGLAQRGTLDHVSRGVYRLAAFPPSRFDEYFAAHLWPVGATGVISHESVLDLLDLCDVNPARIHVTVPSNHRIRRPVPAALELHRFDIRDDEKMDYEAIPMTTVDRAVRDCRALGTGRHLLADAVTNGRKHGWLSQSQAQELSLLLGPIAHPDVAAGA